MADSSQTILYGSTPAREQLLVRRLKGDIQEHLDPITSEVSKVIIPAGVIYDLNGKKFSDATLWLKNHKLHRPSELGSAVITKDHIEYWVDGERHRQDGPAIITADSSEYWYQSDKLHRLDGAAVTRADGSEEYWLRGQRYRSLKALKAGECP